MTIDAGPVAVDGNRWGCVDCRVAGDGGPVEAQMHVRDVHAGEPHVDRCGWCDTLVPLGATHCGPDHERFDLGAASERDLDGVA